MVSNANLSIDKHDNAKINTENRSDKVHYICVKVTHVEGEVGDGQSILMHLLWGWIVKNHTSLT